MSCTCSLFDWTVMVINQNLSWSEDLPVADAQSPHWGWCRTSSPERGWMHPYRINSTYECRWSKYGKNSVALFVEKFYISATVLQYVSLQYLHTIIQLILCSFIYLYMKSMQIKLRMYVRSATNHNFHSQLICQVSAWLIDFIVSKTCESQFSGHVFKWFLLSNQNPKALHLL